MSHSTALPALRPSHHEQTLGLWLGLIGMVVFALTLPRFRGLALGGALRVSQLQLLQPSSASWPPCRCWENRWTR